MEGLEFRKSSYSASVNCIEIANTADGGWAIRDSEDPDGPVLRFTAGQVDAFRRGLDDGEFDR